MTVAPRSLDNSESIRFAISLERRSFKVSSASASAFLMRRDEIGASAGKVGDVELGSKFLQDHDGCNE